MVNVKNIPNKKLPYGVTVTQRPLEPWFWVRILVGQQNLHKKMTRKTINKKIFSTKVKGLVLTFFYVFLLSLTTFHHHPINLADTSLNFTKSSNKTSSYRYTLGECPIVNFSQNGFNTTFTSNSSIEPTFQILLQITLIKNNISKNRYSYSHFLRGPPSFSFI